MNFCISSVFSIFIVSFLVLTQEGHANSHLKDNNSANFKNSTDLSVQPSQIQVPYQDYENPEPHFILSRSFSEVRKRKPKRKRQSIHPPKSSRHARNGPFKQFASAPAKSKKNLHSGENREVKIYETFEEIHEHINEPDDKVSQLQASKRYESHEDPVVAETTEEKKQEPPMKIKVKHHHHHHHHNHIKEVIKTVPKPYPVEKIVHVPIEKIVEKIVQVPKIVNVTVEKIIHVPVEKVVEKVIRVPKPVHIPKPYVIEKIMEKIVHVPKPYPVLKTVPYPVEIKVPVTVEKKVPVPYTVEVERKVPVYIKSQEPYKYEPPQYKHFDESEMSKLSPNYEETASQPVYMGENYSFNPRFSALRKPQYQTFAETVDQPPTSPEGPKQMSALEESTAESSFLPISFVHPKPQFNIIVANNATSFDMNPQHIGNRLPEVPFPFPIEFIQMQPMPFQSPLRSDPATTAATPRTT